MEVVACKQYSVIYGQVWWHQVCTVKLGIQSGVTVKFGGCKIDVYGQVRSLQDWWRVYSEVLVVAVICMAKWLMALGGCEVAVRD